MHALARRLQDRAHERDRRTFAIGAADMDDRRQLPLRMTKRGKKALDAAERQIDAFGMQREQPSQDRVDRYRAGRRRAHAGAGAGAGRLTSGSCGTLAGALVSSRHRLAMVARS